MDYQVRKCKKELIELASLVEKLELMQDSDLIDLYDASDFAIIENQIKDQKDLLISEIKKV